MRTVQHNSHQVASLALFTTCRWAVQDGSVLLLINFLCLMIALKEDEVVEIAMQSGKPAPAARF